ncbi:hypothetical protein AAHC03_021 [Spirometra sp. Aus1]
MFRDDYLTRSLLYLALISLQNLIYASPTEVTAGVTRSTDSLPYFYTRDGQNSVHLGAQNASLYTKCIGCVRGILRVAGLHLGQRYEVISECPAGTPTDLATKCRSDQIDFSPNEEKETRLRQLESNLMQQLQHSKQPRFVQHHKLAIQKVSPVMHTPTGRVFANIFCAQCHAPQMKRGPRLGSGFAAIPKQLMCDQDGEEIRCFVYAELDQKVPRCELDVPGPRMMFSWDSILQLPDDIFGGDEEKPGEKEKTLTDRVFDVLQWICCVFSLLVLSLAIAVFGSSSRLRRPLPGKMLIALCCTLLGAMIAFFLASGLMELVPQIGQTVRPVCVLFAVLLQTFLLASFAWMALFAVELFRTFGLARAWRNACRNLSACCGGKRGGGGRGANGRNCNAAGMMLHSRGGQDSHSTRRFRGHLAASILLPLCFALPAVTINELVFAKLPNDENANATATTETPVPASILGHLYPGFCPPQHANLAWFTTKLGILIWFLGPAALMICFNSLALLIVCVQICRLSRDSPSVRRQGRPGETYSSLTRDEAAKRRKNSRSLAAICGKLVVILGGSWFLQLLASWWPQLDLLRRIAGLVNCAQGGVVALSMLLSTKARRAMMQGLSTCCGGDAGGATRSTDYSSRATNAPAATTTATSVRLQQSRSSGGRTIQAKA